MAAAEQAAAVAVRDIKRQVTRAEEERALVRALAMRAAAPETSLADTLTAGGWADVTALLRWAADATASADEAIATAEASQAEEQAVRSRGELWWWVVRCGGREGAGMRSDGSQTCVGAVCGTAQTAAALQAKLQELRQRWGKSRGRPMATRQVLITLDAAEGASVALELRYTVRAF